MNGSQETGAIGVARRKIRSAMIRLRAFVNSQRMGASPSSIYDEAFYDEFITLQQSPSAQAVADILIEMFQPDSVFDVGCGNGIYARQFADRGVRTFACDGSIHAIRRVPENVFCVQHDLKEPLVTNQKLDLAICFEVAEHIPKRFAENLVASCAALSDAVVFSSAPPGQGGHDHINEQPDQYWHEIFLRHGVDHIPSDTADLRDRFAERDVIYWLVSNSRVYRRRSR